MNPLIEKQLGKLFIAKPDMVDGNRIVFRKVSMSKVEVDHTYLIRLDLNLLSGDSTAYNMNGGKLPLCNSMVVNVMAISRGMAQVTGAYQGLAGMWSGWLPLTQIDVIKEVI